MPRAGTALIVLLSVVSIPAERRAHAVSPGSFFSAGANRVIQASDEPKTAKVEDHEGPDTAQRRDGDDDCGDRQVRGEDRERRRNLHPDRDHDCDARESFSISGAINSMTRGAGATVNLGGTATGTAIANRRGAYHFDELPSGTYLVTPRSASYAFTPASRVVRITTTDVKGVDFSASPAHALTGTITPATVGAGAMVTLTGGGTTTADSAGHYAFTGLANGRYTVTPSKVGFAFTPSSRTVSLSGRDLTHVDFVGATLGDHLVFFDDFTGPSVDLTQWTVMNREGDQSNSELQCYQPANVATSAGNLQIISQVQPITCDGTNYSYTSGMVQWTSFNFTYGTVEFRAKLPAGQGPWPAVWMLGANCQASNIVSANNVPPCSWPQPGSDEIDIAEVLQSTPWQINEQMFSGIYTHGCSPGTADLSLDFHTYQLDWSAGSLVWKIDGTQTCQVTDNVPSTPMFLMINTAMGGAGGPVDDSTLPQMMFVDYLKVTQK